GPACRVGAGPADLAEEGAGHRLLPGQAGGAPVVLRARRHRDHPSPRVPVGGRGHVAAAAGLRAGGGGRVTAPQGGPMTAGRGGPLELLRRLEGNFSHAVIAFVDPQGYPMSVATGFSAQPERGVVVLDAVAGPGV